MEKIIKKNIKGLKYERLLNWLFEFSSTFSFVTRKDVGVNKEAIKLIEELANFLIDSHPTNKWLSNEIIDSPIIGHNYYYELNKETKDILLENSNTLFDWGDDFLTELPEDIAFYKKDRESILYVNGHENYAIVNISSLKEYLKLTLI